MTAPGFPWSPAEDGRLRRTVSRVCPRHLGLEVDDLVQEARLRVWRASQRGEIRALSAFLLCVAFSVVRDAIRQVKRRAEVPLEAAPEGVGESPDALVERRRRWERLARALSNLPPGSREAIALFSEGRSVTEVAAMLGWSVPRARSSIYRRLAALRRCLPAWEAQAGASVAPRPGDRLRRPPGGSVALRGRSGSPPGG